MELSLREYMMLSEMDEVDLPMTRSIFNILADNQDKSRIDQALFNSFCRFMNSPEVGGYDGLEDA